MRPSINQNWAAVILSLASAVGFGHMPVARAESISMDTLAGSNAPASQILCDHSIFEVETRHFLVLPSAPLTDFTLEFDGSFKTLFVPGDSTFPASFNQPLISAPHWASKPLSNRKLIFTAAEAATSYAFNGNYPFSTPYGCLMVALAWYHTSNSPGDASTILFNDTTTADSDTSLAGSAFTFGGTQGQYFNNTGAFTGLITSGHHSSQSSSAGSPVDPQWNNPLASATSMSEGDVAPPAVTPLPRSVWGAIALLGGWGVAGAFRRRKGARV